MFGEVMRLIVCTTAQEINRRPERLRDEVIGLNVFRNLDHGREAATDVSLLRLITRGLERVDCRRVASQRVKLDSKLHRMTELRQTLLVRCDFLSHAVSSSLSNSASTSGPSRLGSSVLPPSSANFCVTMRCFR